jgi:hypothetical protein
MSITHTVHIGPYVLCRDILIDIPKEDRVCVNQECPYYHKSACSSPFCPECGHKIQIITKIQRACRVFANQVYEDINEVLSPVESHDSCCWVANKPNPTDYSYDPYHCGQLSITYQENYGFKIDGGTKPGILGPEEGIELFKSIYKNELEHLMNAYGDENVEIHWGILNWDS